MRESTLRLVNYGMVLAILATLAVHLASHAFLGVSGYEESLTYGSTIGRYRDVGSATVLGVLLVATAYHGLYGLRRLLLGIRPGRGWDRAVSLGTLALGVALVGWGLRTIVLVNLGG